MNIEKKILLIAALSAFAVSISGCAENTSAAGSDVNAEIMPVKNGSSAIYTLVSDDGDYNSGLILNALAAKYGLHVTVSGVVDIVNPHLAEWQNIEKQGFVEMISHSYTHLKVTEEGNVNADTLKHEYLDSRDYFEKNFSTDQIAFVPPENVTSKAGYQLWQDNNFYAVRMGARGYNTLQPQYGIKAGEWLCLFTNGIGDAATTAERNAWIDTAVSGNNWLIEMWHNISPNGDSGYQPISTAMAEEHMKYISKQQEEGKIWAASFTEAVKYIYEKQISKVSAKILNNKISVSLAYPKDKLPADKFNYPLTVKMSVPKSWKNAKIVQNKNSADLTVHKTSDGGKYVLANVVPNASQAVVQSV